MKSRFLAGMLAIFLGTFGAQKFYLGRKKEGIACILLSWSGISLFLGIFEGIWFITRSEKEWSNYLEDLKKPKSYLQEEIIKHWLYPVGLSSFILGSVFIENPILQYAGILFILVIWLYPGKDEKILQNRLKNIKKYPARIVGTIISAIVMIAIISQGNAQAPIIKILSNTTTSQTGGVYNFQFEVSPVTKVLVNNKEVGPKEKSVYEIPLELSQKTKRVHIVANYRGKETIQDVTITRALTNEEITAETLIKQEAENKRIAEKQAKQEEIEKQKTEEDACMKNPKCKKEKEDQKKLAEAIEKDAKLDEWIKNHDVNAWSFCKQATTSQLKSPSIADFPWTDYKIWAAGGFIYVHSYVDAQNSFGAKLRSNFTCKFQLEGDELSLVDLSIE